MISVVYVNVEDVGGAVEGESHLLYVNPEGEEEIFKFYNSQPYQNEFEQNFVILRVMRSIMEQAQRKTSSLRKELLPTNNK